MEYFEMLKLVDDDKGMSSARVFQRFKRFSDCWKEVEDDERPSPPATAKTESRVQKIGGNVVYMPTFKL